MIGIIDYKSGNIKSITNILDRLGETFVISDNPSLLKKADKLIFPGQGRVGFAMSNLQKNGLDKFIKNWHKPFLGICLGMQILFEFSEEDNIKCLGIISGRVLKYEGISTPQIGWNRVYTNKNIGLWEGVENGESFYFVNSYYVETEIENIFAVSNYCKSFVSGVVFKNFLGVQFHPEKSSNNGYKVIENFVRLENPEIYTSNDLQKRVIACMDIKYGEVYKGVGYKKLVEIGNPVELAQKYSNDGADEIIFLDIGATVESRKLMKDLVSDVSKVVNIPLTVGGGIRTIEDIEEILNFGADKVSIGSSAVTNPKLVKDAVAQFGSQCIVVSIDPRKIGANWYQFIEGGTKNTQIDVLEFAQSMESLGVGELLVNSLDRDGTGLGYDLELIKAIRKTVSIPIIASSGVGKLQHFKEGLDAGADAVLGAGIFHRNEISIGEVKEYLKGYGYQIR